MIKGLAHLDERSRVELLSQWKRKLFSEGRDLTHQSVYLSDGRCKPGLQSSHDFAIQKIETACLTI